MKTLLVRFQNYRKGVSAVMINYFAMQVELGWITIEQVPRKYRQKVRELLEASNVGLSNKEQEQA